MQKSEWITRQYESMPQRALIAEVAEHFTQHPLDHWHQLLDTVDCCYAPLLTPGELSANPQIQVRQMLSESGPGYPAWINQQAVEVSAEIEQISSQDQLHWNSTVSS